MLEVLIDTWWNVNINVHINCFIFILVLIDTWWNVNAEISRRDTFGHWGFNRYMVECECKKSVAMSVAPSSFNRYMVECECIPMIVLVFADKSFNRYMVECESGAAGLCYVPDVSF